MSRDSGAPKVKMLQGTSRLVVYKYSILYQLYMT